MAILQSTIVATKYLMNEEDSDDSDKSKKTWGGSSPGRSKNIRRDFEDVYKMLVHHSMDA